MGYLLTPTQKEKDTNFINSTLEDLKTTNLLKNAQAGASNASLNAQNTNIPQTTISQTMADNAKNIGFGTNMLNQATNTQATQAKPTQTNNSGIAMSSDKFFNPQAQETTQIPLQTQAKPKTTLLQRERDSINIDKQFDSSVYSRNNVEFLGNPRTFSNHKLAMEAKSRLYDNYADDINENELSELIKRHKILDKAVDALETAKATFGENSKEYKKIFNDYMQYGILKDNNIKDYASLAEFYNNGGNVGFNPKIKTTENATNTNENTTNSNKNNTNFKSIDDFIYQQKKFINDEMRNSDESVFKHIAKRATKIYDTGSQLNSSKQNKQGLNANNAISLMADREMLDNTTKSGLERVNTTQDTSYRDKENATQEQYNKVVADIIDGSYTDKRLTTMSKDWENNKGFLTHAGNALMLPLDLGADTLKGAVNMVSRGMAERYHNKADLVLNEFKLLDKSGASVDVFGSGENGDNLLQMSNYLDKAFSADKKTSSLWENEAKPKLVQYLKAQEKDKDKAWQDYQNAMQKVQEVWDNAPSKLLANSELVELAETMKTQHDYGRFVLNLFKNPNENRELAQSYLNDLHTILKQNDDFKDISEVVLTKSGQVAVKRGDNYETLEQGFLNSILHGIHDSVNEIGLSVGGAIAGGIKGASQAKSLQGKVAGSIVGGVAGGAIGAGLGAITDEQINSWTTGYKNADNGLKRGIEAAGLNIAADIVMIGGGYAIKQGIKGLKNVSDFSVGSSVSGLKDKAMTFANGNVNAVSNFLAKNALEQSEKDLITKEAQAKFLNGRSLQEFRSDTSIPRLERLKTAWQYEKFINKESMDKGKLKLDSLSKEFEKFQTTSMESNRPIMDIFQDMFEGKATRNEREKFLRFVSQNEGLKSALSSVIAKNPTLALNFGKFIDKRASAVAKSIESEALSQGMFKDLDSSYAKALKDRYGKVEFDIIKTLDDINFSDVGIKIHDILTDLKGSIPHVTNAGQTINAMLEKLNARNSMEAVLNDTIEPNLKIDDLLNIRKYYNDILRSKDFKNASYKHLQAINKEIDLAIEKELENLANNSGINTSKLLKNYKEINKEYADYARFKDSDFYKDTIKSKKREKELSNESFNKAILKQAQREEGFNNKVFNRIANNTDKNLQAQAIKELIQKNIANGNGQFRAVKWQELIDDLAKIEHSITDEGLKGLVSNLKQAQKLYHADNEFLQAVQRSIGSKPANVLISAASGFFGRTLLLFYNALHKIMSRYAGALSENLAHQSLEHQLSLALRYARDTKDFINVSIDSITKKLPLDDRETSKVLKELEYWKKQFEKDEVSSFYDIKEAQRVEQEIQAHKEVLQERKEVLDRQVESIKADLQDLMQEASKESIKGGGNESVFKMERRIEIPDMDEREVPKWSKDKLEWYLDEAMQRLDSLLAKKADLEKELEHEKSLDGKWDDIYAHLKSEAITSSKRAINAVKRDIENTKEWINELRADIDSISPKALITIDNALNVSDSKALISIPNNVSASKALINMPNNVSASKALTQVSTNKSSVNKPSMATNLLTYNTKALPNANTTSKDLIPSNVSTSKDLIPLNQKLEKLKELERYLHKLQKLENHFKDFMSMPFSVIVDSKGNAMPLTIEALKSFIFQNLYKEWLNTRKALNMPTLELDFKPLTNRIKALPYKASSEVKAHLNMVNEKTNSFLDSLQDLKAKAQDLKLLPYKSKESEASGSRVDKRLQNHSLIAETMQKNMINPNEHYDIANPKYNYKYLENKEILKVPDFALSENDKAVKRAIENEPKQRELIQEINTLNDKQKYDKFSDFMDKEREALKALKLSLEYDEAVANRFIDMGNAINDKELRLKYFDKTTDCAFYNCGLNNDSIGYKALKKAYDDLSETKSLNTEIKSTESKDSKKTESTLDKIEKDEAKDLSKQEVQQSQELSKEVETFTDSKGNTHEIPKDIADKWKEAFHLKSLDESYTPSFKPEVKQALDSVLQGEDITLSAGSLVKLIGRDRLEFLPYIKETLENSNAVVRQADGALIFAKDYRDDSLGKFFASVARDENGEWTIRSNAPKSLNGLQNKIKEGGEVLYSDLPELPIIAKPELTAKALNGEANQADSTTKYPNTEIKSTESKASKETESTLDKTLTQEAQAESKSTRKIINEAKDKGLSVKETKELIQKNTDENNKKIQEVKELIKKLKSEARELSKRKINGLVARRRNYHAQTKDQRDAEYIYRLNDALKENGISREFHKLEALKRDENLSPKQLKKAQEELYLTMHENMQKAEQELSERARAFIEQIRQEELAEANEWLEKNAVAHSPLPDEIDKEIQRLQNLADKAARGNNTEEHNKILRQIGTLTYKKNGEFGAIDLSEFTLFDYYKISLPFLKSRQAEFGYSDKAMFKDGDKWKPMLDTLRKEIEIRADIQPIAEFGTNYAEFFRDGRGGIEKLMAEARDYEARKASGELTQAEQEAGAYKGQVAGAFYREELGDIDLVWGEVTNADKNKGYGLAHILDKRTAEFMEKGLSEQEALEKATEFVRNEINNIIENGIKTSNPNEATKLETTNYKLILKQNWKGEPTENKWIVSAYIKNEEGESISSTPFTKGDNLPLNSNADSTTKSPNTENNLDTINIENSTITKDIHANTEKDTKASTSKDRPSEIENGSNTDDNFIHSHKGDNPQGNNERTESTERDTRASNGNGWQSETMAQKGEENANGEWNIRNNSSQSSSDTKGIDDISQTQQGHNARGRPKNATKNGYKQGGWHDVPKSRDRLHRNVSLKKKDSIALESKEANKDTLSKKHDKETALESKDNTHNLNAETDTLQTKLIDFKKEFSLDDSAFKPIGHIKGDEILDETNTYQKILNPDTYNKDGFIISVDSDGLLKAIDLNGFNLGRLYGSKSNRHYFEKAQLKDLKGFDSFMNNGKIQTIDEAKDIAKAKASKAPYINPYREKVEFITNKNIYKSTNGVEFFTIDTPDLKQIEPISSIALNSKYMQDKDSEQIREVIKRALNRDKRLYYLAEKGFIDEDNLSDFQKLILKDIIAERQKSIMNNKELLELKEEIQARKNDKKGYFSFNTSNKDSNGLQTESKSTREIIKQAKEKGLSVKETKGLIEKNKQDIKTDNIKNNELIDEANKAYKDKPQSDKEIDNIQSTSNPAGILNPEETAMLNKEFKLGELEDLKGQKALYDANIKSLELLDDILKSGRVANDEEKQILSNFRGFGKASNELTKIIKEKGQRLEQLNKLLDSLSNQIGKKVDSNYLYRRGDDAYYTPTSIAESMVKLAKDLGLNDKHCILEPSCGSGRFLGQFNASQKVVGIDIDPLTAKIAKTIYPYYKIDNAGFEKSKYAVENAYDLVIGNPPYSNFTIKDDYYKATAHNYFMKKGIDMLSNGGISIQIVTKNFMDSSNLATKLDIAKDAKFLGGVRLPNNAFKDASVTTDILVFKKDKALAKHADKSWIETSELNGIPVSKYFLDNPQNVLGEMRVGKGQFGDIVHVINKEEIDFSELDLAKYLTYRDKDIDNITRSDEAIDIDSAINSIKDKKQYDSSVYGRVSFNNKSGEFIKDGEAIDIRQMLNDLEVRWADSTIEKRIEEFKEQAPKINKVQEALYKLQNAEIEDDVDNLANFRRELNEAYDELLGKNGAFHTKNGNIAPKFKLFEMLDDTSFEVFALEKAPILKNGKVVGSERADIFTKRVSYPYVAPQSAENLSNATAISLNEYGYNSYERIAELLNRDVDSVKKELLDKKLEYLDHNGDRYQKDEFLSGDVKTKLEAFHDEYGLPKFSNDENTAFYQKIAYDDLKAVIPDDIELPLIDIPLGANWLDKNITDSFLRDIIGLQNLTTNYIHGKGFSIHFTHVGDREFLIATGKDFYKQTGMEYISGIKYIEDMLNNKTLLVQKTIKLDGAKEKMTIKDPIATQGLENLKKQLQREFKQYILDNDTFATTAQKQYNDTFNREVRRKYDGSHIQLIGANKDIELREHQKNASYRFFQERSVLLAHDVGTGKSYTMIASALEGKRMKLYNKPIIIAPNHIAPQLAVDARKLYPNANIKLVQAVSRKNKNKELASLKNNKHDLIIGTLTAFTNMNVSPNLFNRYMKQEIKYLKKIESELLNNSNTDAPTRELKIIARRIDNAEKKIKAYIDKVANDKQNVFFEELGIDCLMFDEAHYLKNLPILTAQKNVRGIGNSDSQRAIDAYMKINSLKDNPNSKVLFATGTPITNFISDIYTMQKYMDFDSLERAGIDVFDEWCKQFAGASYEFEMKATGDYKLTSRLRDFRNLPELKNMYYKFADLVTKEDMQKAILENGGKIVEPKINRVNVVLPRNKEQIKFMEEVKKRAKKIEKDPRSAMQKGADNMLKIISDTNKASIDMRLLNPNLKRDENGKIAQCANNILEVYKEFDKHKGTQLVFLDNSVPKKPVKEETLQKWIKELDHTKNILDTKEHEMTSEMAQKLNYKIDNLEGKIAQANCSFSAYDDLKEVLIEKGLKDNEIAFVHDYDGKKELLADKINKGEIRVLIGSTGKMGAGCNFQERLTALHHLDLDWTPANMEQREGRIIRQGNTLMDLVPNFEARIYTYVTEQMSDSLMLQTLEQKTKIIKQIQNPNIMTRKIEDTSEDNLHGRLKAMSSPNAEQELEAMSIVKLIDEISNTISTHDIILKNNKAKMEQASKLESITKEKIDRLEPFINTTKDNTIISFDKEKIDFEKKPAQNKKAKDSKDKAIDKSPKELANQKLNKLIQDFAKSDNKLSIICGYRGLNIIAYKGYKGIDFYLGKDLKDSFPISTTIELREASYGEKDYMQRFDNGYNKLSKDTFKKELQADLQEAKDKRDKALRAFEKESANKDDIAILRNELQDKLVRQAELHYFLGRADNGEKERLMAVYGEDFDGIVKEKFEKAQTKTKKG